MKITIEKECSKCNGLAKDGRCYCEKYQIELEQSSWDYQIEQCEQCKKELGELE